MLQGTWMCKYLCEILFSVLLDEYPEVGLLDHDSSIFNFWRNLHIILYLHLVTEHSHQQGPSVPVLQILTSTFFLLFAVIWQWLS